MGLFWKSIALCAILLVFPGCFGSRLWAADQPVGVLAGIRGEVLIRRAMQTAFRAAVLYERVHEGDRIRTGAGAMAKILYDDDSMTILSGNSSIEIQQYRLAAGRKRLQARIRLLRGRLRFIVTKFLLRGRANFRVQTPTAVMGVRGSDGVVVLEGKITIIFYLSGNQMGLEVINRVTGTKLFIDPGHFLKIYPDGSVERGVIDTEQLEQLLKAFARAATEREREALRQRILEELGQEGLDEILGAPDRLSDRIPTRKKKKRYREQPPEVVPGPPEQ